MSHSDPWKNLPLEVKAVRSRLGLTQTQFAKLIGIGQSSLSDIETGKTQNVKGKTLLGVATALRRIPMAERPDPSNLLWADPVSPKEGDHLSLFRLLSQSNQETLQSIAKTLLDAQKANKSRKPGR